MHCPDFSSRYVVVIGDIMLDRYYWGEVDRISPEAPVPVVIVNRKTVTLGGAGNVATNLKGLNCGHMLIGLRGMDTNGDILVRVLEKEGIRHRLVAVQTHPTTTKTRVLGQGQQLVRLDEERSVGIDRRTVQELLNTFETCLDGADAVVISDYGKGIFESEAAHGIIQQCRNRHIPVFVDPKGLSWERYKGATCITPNTAEFKRIAPFPEHDEKGLQRQAERVMAACGLEYLLLTQGARGMSLFRRSKPAIHIDTEAQEVFDVSGAGDTVIASLAAACSAGMAMTDAARLANTAAGIVVGKIGTQPVNYAELRQALSSRTVTGARKVVTIDQAAEMAADWRRDGRLVVFTNGCFDILHVGHIKLLHAAAAEGDRLIVGLNSDSSVKRLKGDSRPIVPEEERAELLASIRGVDLVVVFGEDTPIDLIRRLKPDVLVKGGDYTPETVVGHDIVAAGGGQTVIVPLIDGISSSHVIDAIKQK
ncbi:MAG: bifunctional D-glycero-beta-D-manno-heptose-7-phosphate kinase/D-glycero-beta-D-manno-heptose 1-phosphate adenylyltransferase HldE [Deltaproteobacteria bacterium]|nr:bifunctional D-glycero-beta-D-manno-heptose-7-phosphate kinase/D-glycero-beta-D-manno-heptose 1-phosphate adenylyltransferase HldE [Deltaproteobacteria bacterium]